MIFFVSRFFCIRNDNNYEVSYHVQKIYQSIYFYFNFLRRWINRISTLKIRVRDAIYSSFPFIELNFKLSS